MKESRISAEKLLEIHEQEKAKLTYEYQRRREFYSQGLISRSELNQVEQALAEAIVRVESLTSRSQKQPCVMSCFDYPVWP
jgi:multidrug resistance efflux pump